MILIHPIIRQQFFGSILQGRIQEFWKLINDVIASWLSKQNMLKLHLSYIELAIFRAQICLDIIDHGDAIFYPFSLVIVWNKRTTVGRVYVLIDLRNCPKMVATLHFYGRWEKRPKKIVGERKLLYETNELQFFLDYILIDHRNDQKWLQRSISMIDKRIDLENCCREKVISKKQTNNSFP